MNITRPPVGEASPSLPDRLRRKALAFAEEVFDEAGLETLFAHARNVLTGAAVLAAGVYAASHFGSKNLPGMWGVHLAGYVIAGLGGVMLLLNLLGGLRRLARRKHHVVLRLVAIFLYVALSVRLTQVLIYFRSSM